MSLAQFLFLALAFRPPGVVRAKASGLDLQPDEGAAHVAALLQVVCEDQARRVLLGAVLAFGQQAEHLRPRRRAAPRRRRAIRALNVGGHDVTLWTAKRRARLAPSNVILNPVALPNSVGRWSWHSPVARGAP